LPALDPNSQRSVPFFSLLGKELRDLARGNALWGSLLIVILLAGYSYVQAIQLFGEASRSSIGVPELARGLSPLDGIVAPTFGALYLVVTFLFPFIVIRTVAAEKQSGSLLLLLQLPYSTATMITAKFIASLAAWLLLLSPCLAALVFWKTSGGHLGGIETANLALGHLLYALVVTAVSLLAATTTSQTASAGIIVLAVTIGSWVLDFAAAGEDGVLKHLAGLSLTQLLREFERGIFSLSAVLSVLIAAAGICAAAAVWLHPGTAPFRKWTRTLMVLAISALAIAGSAHLRVFRDATENRRNSFAASDETALRGIDAKVRIEVHFAAEDPRYYDFERSVLGKLRRVLPNVAIVRSDEGFHQVLTGSGDDSYGLIVYSVGGRSVSSRSTSEEEALPIIFDLAGVKRPSAGPDRESSGYPLIADATAAKVAFYGVFPLLVVALGGLIRFGTVWRRISPSHLPRRSS
jgi:ABC-type transport system involved in multi-copper enzyme maturation permease subunit